MSRIERIFVDAPNDEARRERIERRVLDRTGFERRGAGESPRRRGRPIVAAALTVALAAAGAVVWLALRRPSLARERVSEITTPVGGATRVQLDDAILEVGGASSLRVVQGADGTTTVQLATGTITCDVEPRSARTPFRVLAGDVTVEVVGTRFTVERAQSVRVAVERGKVRVNDALVGAGETWLPAPPPPAPPPVVDEPVEPQAAPTRPKPAPSRETLLSHAQGLEETDRPKMIRILGELAKGSDAPAQEATFMLVQMGERDVDAYLDRFGKGIHAEDVQWIRVERHLSAGRKAEAKKAALDYLKAYPRGAYVDPIHRVLAAP